MSGILIDLLNFVGKNVGLIEFLGILTNLSKTYLGMTIIAMGNALPDALTTIALAKQGFAIMGMTGAYKYLINIGFKICWLTIWIISWIGISIA